MVYFHFSVIGATAMIYFDELKNLKIGSINYKLQVIFN